MLPGAGRWDNNPRRGDGDCGDTRGTELIVLGGLIVDLGKEGGQGRDKEIRGSDGKLGGSCGKLRPETVGVVQGSEDVGSGESGKGSEVPDGLYPEIQPSDLPERGCPRPKAKL